MMSGLSSEGCFLRWEGNLRVRRYPFSSVQRAEEEEVHMCFSTCLYRGERVFAAWKERGRCKRRSKRKDRSDLWEEMGRGQ